MKESAAFIAEAPRWNLGSASYGFGLALKLQVFECLVSSRDISTCRLSPLFGVVSFRCVKLRDT